MSTIYPRQRVLPADISTSTPINYLPHLSYILSLEPLLDRRCAGYVNTDGRRCTTETNPQDRSEAIALLETATADVRAGRWRDIENNILEELARRLLCSETTHQAQARSLVQRWRADFQAFVHGYEMILGLNDADMMTEWDNVNMNLDNKSWCKRVSRGIRWGFDHLALAQIVRSRDPGFLCASRALRENLAHQHLQGSSSDWNGNVDREFLIDPDPGRTTSTSTSTSTRTGHGIYNNPSTNAQHPPIGIPAPTQNHSSAFGFSRLAPKKTEMSRNHQDNTVERLRQPIDGDCSICLISLLDEPSDFNFYTDSAYTESITDPLSSPFSDSSYQWHETDTGTPGLTDLMRRDYAYHRVLSYVFEGGPEINVRRQGKIGERKYPARPELSWCQAGCGVNYHKRCLDKWVAMAPSGLATCPSCRRRWVGDSHHRGSSYGVPFRGRR